MPASAIRTLIASSVLVVVCLANMFAGSEPRVAEAARNRDTAAVRALVQAKVDVNAPQADGATALHWAVHWDDLAMADLLLRAGADARAADDLGVTPLSLACANGNALIVDRLLAAGADPNAAALPTGVTPLMTAARTGNADAVQALLSRGARVNAAETAHGQTALMWAAAQQHADVVRALIAHGADVHARSRTNRLLVMAGSRYSGQNEIAGAAEIEAGGYTPLLFAARQGDAESAYVLISAGARVDDVAADGTSALTIAAHSDNGAVASVLLDKGADPNAAGSGYTVLHGAVLRGDLALVRELLAHGANPNAPLTKGTPVHRFSRDFALSSDWRGATPFWLAAKFAEVEIIKVLAAAGANTHVAIDDGTTALMVAAGLGTSASRDRRERWRAPLEVAAKADSGDDERIAAEAVRTLLALGLGVTVAAVNEAGDTALHGAASNGYKAVIQLLAAAGANLDARNKGGQTPLLTARGRPRKDGTVDTSVADLLRSLGAKP